jgi:hypothetical protein
VPPTVAGERGEQLANGARHEMALALPRDGSGGDGLPEGGKGRGQLAEHADVQAESAGRAGGGGRVERVGEQRERQVALELRGAAGEHQRLARCGDLGELLQQPRLPDSRSPRSPSAREAPPRTCASAS